MVPLLEDFKQDGLWVVTKKLDGVKHYTISGRVWTAMKNRCSGPATKRRQPRYKDCVNGFSDFQTFVEWHRSQVGYGKGFALDKDVLGNGKLYSETTCVLVPQQINNLVIKSGTIRGAYPIGVCYEKESGKFTATCKIGSYKTKKIGRYATAHEAFAAYKMFKEQRIKMVADEWKDQIDLRVYDYLYKYEVKETD